MWSVASWVCLITLSKLQRNEKKRTAHRNTEEQGREGQKQSRHVAFVPPSIVLARAAGDSPLCIPEIASALAPLIPLSLSLSLAVSSLRLHFSFPHPNFLPACQEAMSFTLRTYTQYLRRHSCSSPGDILGLQLCPFSISFSLFSCRGWGQARGQIKAETDRYGNVPCRTCLFFPDSPQEA